MGCCASTEADVDFNAEVNFDHFRVLRSIGRGAFGKVCIVERRDTHKQFAMKYVNKKHCIESKSGPNTLREQEILACLDGSCPFIVNLWYAFQDPEDLFFVVDYMSGGDLSFHLRQATFDETRMRLYCCEVAVALAYLHANQIIHRDIKPENLLLESTGHVRVTDFNVAFKYSKGGHSKPRAIAGTRPYMAPEMLVGGGKGSYTAAVDWWSLGISMYECVVGKLPYHIQQNATEQELRDYFGSNKVSYPASLSRDCCYALQQFLRMTVSRRVQDVEFMKKLDFFKSIDFDAVGRGEVAPSFTPQANLMNCDPMHELEEMIVEPQPLHKKKKRMKKRNEEEEAAVGDDLRNLEENFFTYDRLKGGRQDDEAAEGGQGVTTAQPSRTSVSVDGHEGSRISASLHSIDYVRSEVTIGRTASQNDDLSSSMRPAVSMVREEAGPAPQPDTPLVTAAAARADDEEDGHCDGTRSSGYRLVSTTDSACGEVKSLMSHVHHDSSSVDGGAAAAAAAQFPATRNQNADQAGDVDIPELCTDSAPDAEDADSVSALVKTGTAVPPVAALKRISLQAETADMRQMASHSQSSMIPLLDATEFHALATIAGSAPVSCTTTADVVDVVSAGSDAADATGTLLLATDSAATIGDDAVADDLPTPPAVEVTAAQTAGAVESSPPVPLMQSQV